MSIKTKTVIEFREKFDKTIDESIEAFTKSKNDNLEKLDDPIRKIMVEDWWDAKIRSLKFAKDIAMAVESEMTADDILDQLK